MNVVTSVGTFRADYTKQGWLTTTQQTVTVPLTAGNWVGQHDNPPDRWLHAACGGTPDLYHPDLFRIVPYV